MNIWHSGAHWSPLLVNGVNALVYSVAQEQASLGHRVTLLLCGPADSAAARFAEECDVRLLQLPSSVWKHGAAASALLEREKPDLVHMHSVFSPQQAALARALQRSGTPYIVTPNGGLSPRILQRNRLKKAVYSQFIERPRFLAAAGISLVTPSEEAEVRSFVPDFNGPMPCIPNSVDPSPLDNTSWQPGSTRPRLVYLGRFDIEHKGIDILLALAAHLPQADFHLYGSEDLPTAAKLRALKQRRSPNVYFHEPVFGKEKASVLSQATLYIQASRWEAFGISIAEAMYLGVPCAIASTLHLAPSFQQHDLGLVFSPDPPQAAAAISRALSEPARLAAWSVQASAYARNRFHPRAVAASFLDCYERSMAA